MPYPNFKDKHLAEPLFIPSDYVKNYMKWHKLNLPKKCIIIFSNRAFKRLLLKYNKKYKEYDLYSNLRFIKISNVGIIKMSGIGAPHAVTILEEIIALGAKEFINIGTAGGLYSKGIFLCNKAIRDEGTSAHYIPHSKYSYPDENLTKKLGKLMAKEKIIFNVAPTWTIDAPYRETKKEIEHYKKQGIATVEMEASALFSVAKFRKVKIASIFVVSDILGEKWEPKFHEDYIEKEIVKLVELSIRLFSR